MNQNQRALVVATNGCAIVTMAQILYGKSLLPLSSPLIYFVAVGLHTAIVWCAYQVAKALLKDGPNE